LINDVPTRWNSTYFMVNRALSLATALNETIQFHKELRPFALNDEEWNMLSNI
ncbi:hypothetical protein K492DRAFT_106269, partial [Lichtheimia hyalospora FSU 10163]